ncbi:thiamine phosphate synthase [Novosphingobium sp.]|jgi:thiamine-phosphate pyrophosphorylase|uniref:thiamine phosphate synthase n=1 Tax=Novosphingobium sp. TaxID=1874826 RepID=UPI0022C91380|nr:thiamine phosphate synthase [Novosphingobium sp.]MCZ8018708.1 thiamine phosphate synthase [Novosphingobium sp.]MCZ8034713.1 thiamine phosphate synthase [Novosphingobium sp.]MCZ8052848.1 thiamine phosphate synthase [Novosphingobium sp.]MCZ8060606.1 thiamine phosphate synthase [Novosphingobium sp.]MCZ8230632.1 thiamine phosphate synthase [Novosphingobium sp.]
MARCYSGPVPRKKPLPHIWLLSDARNDAALERAIKRLPRGSGFVFRHYHLPEGARRARFDRLARLARARGIAVVLAGSAAQARRWGADGSYGPHGDATLATAHSLRELRRACRAAAVLLSPVFPTRSHPGGKALGPLRFRLLAAHAPVPVIALGGMNARTARRLRWPRWAGIDAFLR